MAMAATLRREGKCLAPLISSTPINNNILRSSFISPSVLISKFSNLPILLQPFTALLGDATRNYTSMCRAGYNQCVRNHYLQPTFQQLLFTKLCKGAMFEKHNFLSTTSSNNSTEDGSEQEETISVTFVDKDGEENRIKVPIGMSMLEAAHENDIELEGACEGSLACSTCHVIIMDLEYYNKLEDPTDEENDMLDLAFGLSETSRLGCQVIAKPELDGIRLAIPAATRNFAVDGYVPKPH